MSRCRDCIRTKEENGRLESIISPLMAAIAGVDVQDVGKQVYDKLLESTFHPGAAVAKAMKLRRVDESQ